MTAAPDTGPDQGSTESGLFDVFPDPVLSYRPARSDEPNSRPDALVLHMVNPAFESTFNVDRDCIGTPLEQVTVAGRIVSTTDDDADAHDISPHDTTTVRNILDAVGGTADSTVRLAQVLSGDRRHFHVRAIDTGPDHTGSYLHFTTVPELEQGRLELVARIDRLERTLDVVTHDIRNPLEVARIRLEAAQEAGKDVHFEKVAGALDRIEQLVSDVNSASAGGIDPTDAVALGDATESAWETVDTADATLVSSPDVPTIRADADRLRQIFENLFRNAVEHAGPDVTVAVEPIPDGFAVVDDGPGIPSEVGDSVFRVGVTTTPGSRGLGLAIVDRIAQEHGWWVSVVSPDATSTDSDTGARFEFTDVSILT
ncbi:sensor histidine kinase [Salinigranum rubrum]|uniref:histidine kinase n=1 Tax=Salinigranum rubrum TaxID=755307 RepID=A0A2I8VG60_9EURY|nr:HAMP domain-containing sensor histidine kinase [Salinigranum rubrum]AUV80874.1 sensor histidine kinase [Salinigranum rubrum]